MKKIALLFAISCLVTASYAGSNLRSEIESMDKKVCAAIKKKDVEAFKNIVQGGVTSDFKYTEQGKTMNFDQMVEGMKQGLASMTKVTVVEAKLKSLKEKGNNAVGVTWHHMAGSSMGQDKKNHTMSFEGTSTDTFRKEGGQWKMASMTWQSQKMKMDGKPFDPSKMGGKKK